MPAPVVEPCGCAWDAGHGFPCAQHFPYMVNEIPVPSGRDLGDEDDA